MFTLVRFLADRIIDGPQGRRTKIAWIAGGVAATAALRLALDPLFGATLAAPSYYPLLVLTTLWCGWRIGLVVLLAAVFAGDMLFLRPQLSWPPKFVEMAQVTGFIAALGLVVAVTDLLRRALQELREQRELADHFNAELQHRMQNSIAVAQALATQAFDSESSPEHCKRLIRTRLSALAEAQRILSGAVFEECDLREVVEAALRPFVGSGRIRIDSHVEMLRKASCVPLTLALNELATNALKYGALSGAAGAVDVGWRAAGPLVVLTWREAGGPTVQIPTRQGFGSRLLSRQPGLEGVEMEYAAQGVVCRLTMRRAAGPRRVGAEPASAPVPRDRISARDPRLWPAAWGSRPAAVLWRAAGR